MNTTSNYTLHPLLFPQKNMAYCCQTDKLSIRFLQECKRQGYIIPDKPICPACYILGQQLPSQVIELPRSFCEDSSFEVIDASSLLDHAAPALQRHIFNIDYFTYNKFIDCLLLNIKAVNMLISADLLYFFSTADKYAEDCTRIELGVELMKKNLLKLSVELLEHTEDAELFNKSKSELLLLIDCCLDKLDAS